MEEKLRLTAESLLDNGDLDELYQLLVPYIEAKDPFALNIFSCFGLVSFNETDEEFSKRSILLKTEASEGGIAGASYRMGVNHLYGDDVERDLSKASMYFERAISQGHSHTKFTYGFSIYYGNDGNTKNEKRGLQLITEAASEGIELAEKELEIINGNQDA